VLYKVFTLLLYLYIQDKTDDVQIGVKSTALKFGDETKLWLAGFASGVTGGLAVAGAMCHQPWLYFTGVGVVSAHLAHQVIAVVLYHGDSFNRNSLFCV